MHQGKNTEGITEYHVCSECRYMLSVPIDPKFRAWELACKRKRSEVNPDGGLTRCPIFREKERE